MQHLPVHWYEGLFIRPHHFQAADRYHSEHTFLVDFCNHPYNYGFRSLELNEDAVANYQFQVTACLALMRDGTLVSFQSGQAPDRIETKEEFAKRREGEPETLNDAYAGESSLMINLGVPKLEMGRANVGYPGQQDEERYRVRTEPMADESRGGAVQDIELRGLSACLLGSSTQAAQPPAGYETLPVARIKRAGEESSLPQIDAEYIPPLLAVEAWPRLKDEIEGLYHFIGQNLDTLSQQIVSRRISLASQEAGDLERVFKLRTLNEAYASLRNMIFATGIHPYMAYCELCRYVGMLAIFAEERRVPDCPIYDHDDLGRIFPRVIQRIKDLVESGGKWEWDWLPFKGSARATMEVSLKRKWLNPDWDWYVGVSPSGLSESSCHQLLTSADNISGQVTLDWKIGSAAQVERLYRGRRPGLRLVPLQQAPRALPPGGDWIYYEVARHGDAWTHVQADGTLAMRFNEKLIHNLDSLQDEETLIVQWRGRPANLRFRLFAVPKM